MGAYRKVCKQLGLDIMQVTAHGTHSQAAYSAMIEVAPSLAHESRRGLGLGRKRRRSKNRDKYIAAVLNEQLRQRHAFEKSETGDTAWELDVDALSQVALSVSKQDTDYAIYLAVLYAKNDREQEAVEDQLRQEGKWPFKSPEIPQRLVPSLDMEQEWSQSSSVCSERSATSPLLRKFSDMSLNDMTKDDTPFRVSSAYLSKGFGLSRDKLREVGLAATGHALSRRGRSRGGFESISEDSGCESDFARSEDSCRSEESDVDKDEVALELAKYRSWRSAAIARLRPGEEGQAVASPNSSDGISPTAQRKENRAWRTWQYRQLREKT